MKKRLTVNDFQSVREGYSYATDAFYARLADRLYKILAPYESDYNDKILRRIALKLSWYMEDIVADLGLWRSFSEQCQRLWGFPVPLFHDEEEYYADEPSLNAVSYLVWDVVDESNQQKVPFASNQNLQAMAYLAYSYLNNVFEQCPVNDDRRDFISGLFEEARKGYNETRDLLKWINKFDYMVYSQFFDDDYSEALNSFRETFRDNADDGMAHYFAETSLLFNYRCGPLALQPCEWGAALAHSLGYNDVEQTLLDIEPLRISAYHFDFKGGELVQLVSVEDKEIDVRAEELNLPLEKLSDYDMGIGQFVRFSGEWRLNGVLVPKKLGEKYEEYKKAFSHKPPKGSIYMSAAMYIERAGGKRVLYFKDFTEMTNFLVDHDIATPQIVDKMPNKGDYPVVFFSDEHGKGTMSITFNTSKLIKAPDNPYYDEKEAKEEAITMLWDTDVNPELAEGLIDKGYLPDAADDPVFQPGLTPDELRGDMHFLLRTERRNNMGV